MKNVKTFFTALFLPVSILILKIFFRTKSNKIYLYGRIKILNNTKTQLFSKGFILKIFPKSELWFFRKWKIHAKNFISELYFFSFSTIRADYTYMTSFCKRYILRFILPLSVAIAYIFLYNFRRKLFEPETSSVLIQNFVSGSKNVACISGNTATSFVSGFLHCCFFSDGFGETSLLVLAERGKYGSH